MRAGSLPVKSIPFLAFCVLSGLSPPVWGGHPPPLLGEDCPSLDGPFIFFWDELAEETPATLFCGNEGCDRAELASGPRLEKPNPLCDPQVQNCTLQLRVPLLLRGVAQNHHLLVNPFHPRLLWFKQDLPDPGCTPTSNPLFCSNADCGGPGGTFVDYDEVETYIQVGGLRCSNLTSGNLDVYALSVFTCWDQAACLPASQRRFDLPGLDFTAFSAALAFCSAWLALASASDLPE